VVRFAEKHSKVYAQSMDTTPEVHPEHPLTRWRGNNGWSQIQLAKACHPGRGMIAHIEAYRRIPVHESLERLLDVTGLPTDALVYPKRFLAEHPDFLYSLRSRSPVWGPSAVGVPLP
jgi:transcriptional regulator with XRE-family HTH domain